MVDYLDILSKDYDKNFRKNCKPLQQRCHICNSPIENEATAKMLHMTFDGELSEVETDEETSQGWFIVGSNCYQKYKKLEKSKK